MATTKILLSEVAVSEGGFALVGEENGDQAGVDASAGDVNGDGAPDLIVAAQNQGENGAAYVVFGPHETGATTDLGTAIEDGGGFKIIGAVADGQVPQVVASGDVNADGFDDMLIESGRWPDEYGEFFLLFGRSAFPEEIRLSDIEASGDGVVFQGQSSEDYLNFPGAADLNGDGIDDVIISASGPGGAYVVYGRQSWPARVVLEDMTNGTDGFKVVNTDDFNIPLLSATGDVNGDGRIDLFMGSRWDSEGGAAAGAGWVIYGRESYPARVFLDDVGSTIGGFKWIGEADDDLAESTAFLGDFNSDGYGDFAVGLLGGGVNATNAAYVVYGAESFPPRLPLGDVISGNAGIKILANQPGEFGAELAGIGDANADGVPDLLKGAWSNDEMGTDAGAAYVIYGQAGLSGEVHLADLLENGDAIQYLGENAGDRASLDMGELGDLNQDGVSDFFVGTGLEDPSKPGTAYVVLGGEHGPTVDLAEPNDTLSQASDFTDRLRGEGSITLTGFLGDNPNVDPASNEVDLALFQLTAGEVVTFDTDAAGAGISNLDTVLRVFDAHGAELAVNDDADNLDSQIEFTAPANGLYGVGISSYNNSGYDPNVESSGSGGGSTGDFRLNAALQGGDGDLVFGTPGDDVIDTFRGETTVFAGDGADLVDASQSPGGNTLFGGRDGDTLLASTNDQLFGEGGDDVLNAVAGSGQNRLYGGAENDTLYAGRADSLAGGEGDDRLFAGSGESLLTGGPGADQFWVATAALPDSANTITDFASGEDVIGFGGLGTLELVLDEEPPGNTMLSVATDAGNVPVAALLSVTPDQLSQDDFLFV